MKAGENKGQSLAELGIFGSLILFAFAALISWGLGANYEQEMRMRTFRKSLHWAVANRASLASKPVIIIKDKRVPSPEEITMAGGSVPVSASGSAIWSTQLYLDRHWDAAEIPTITYNINGKAYTYTTAAYRERDNGCGLRRKKLIDTTSDNPLENGRLSGRHWYWDNLDSCKDEDIAEGATFDVNGDIFEELLAEVERDEWGDLVDVNKITKIKYIDYNAGEINLLIDPPNDQGLLPSFSQDTEKTFSMEGSVGGSSETGVSKENFTRKIRTQNGIILIQDANPQDFSLSMSWGK
jgi:hypothetical protein